MSGKGPGARNRHDGKNLRGILQAQQGRRLKRKAANQLFVHGYFFFEWFGLTCKLIVFAGENKN